LIENNLESIDKKCVQKLGVLKIWRFGREACVWQWLSINSKLLVKISDCEIKFNVLQFRFRQISLKVTIVTRTKSLFNFLYIAKGSCSELRTQLYIASEVGVIENQAATDFLEQTRKISAMLYRLIKTRKENFS